VYVQSCPALRRIILYAYVQEGPTNEQDVADFVKKAVANSPV
jgi:hypothetical protein